MKIFREGIERSENGRRMSSERPSMHTSRGIGGAAREVENQALATPQASRIRESKM